MSPIQNLETHAEPFVTVAELAAYWRVSERSLHYHVQKGALPATRVGRTIRIRTEEARRYGRIDDIVTGPISRG